MNKEKIQFELKDKYNPSDYLEKNVIPEVGKVTNELVYLELVDFFGEVTSHSKGLGETMIDISGLRSGEYASSQAKCLLGDNDEITKKELFLRSESLQEYKFGLMVLQYGLLGYPVTVVLEEDIELELYETRNLPIKCNSMYEFGSLCSSVLTSNKLIEVINGVIQAVLRSKDSD